MMQTSLPSKPTTDTSYRLHFHAATASSKHTVNRKLRGESGDLISFLAVAHRHGLDISAIAWELPLGAIGEGGTARVNQSTLNLQWSLAFKRPAAVAIDRSSGEMSQDYQVLMSEIMVLCHAATRNHPNIVTLEGVCWDFHPKTGDAWPVLIFEKAQEGNLGDLMGSEAGRAMNFSERLQLCQDVARALTNLHRYGIIHGDINPRNILAFKESEHYYLKLSDFGYSALMGRDDLIEMATTKPWNAPECDSMWYFDFFSAKKTDIYSLGAVCLWILFRENSHEVDLQPDLQSERPDVYNYHWITQLRRDGKLKAFAASQLEAIADLNPLRMAYLQRFFDLSLSEDPQTRDMFSDGLFYDYQQYGGQIDDHAPDFIKANLTNIEFYDRPDLPYAALFQFSKIWYQTMIGDFRLWRSIFNGLETQAKLHPNRRCQSNAAFQLAFCYQIGFGCDRCGSQSLSWLDRSGRCAEDLDHEVKFIQANEGPWHVGISRELGRPRLQDAYKASNVLIEAEKVYGQAILDLGYLLNKEHDVLILLKASLAQILNELGRSAEAEVLLLATLASSRNISSTLPVLRALKETYFLLGRFKDVEATVLEEKALWDQGNHKSSMAFYDSNAMEEETILRDLAAVYWHQGKYKEMETTVMQRIEVTKKLYGEADRQTLSSMTDLAAVHIHFGRMEQARGILHHAIPIAEKILGKDDPDVLEMSYQLSFAVSTRRERKAGAIIATRNLEDRKRVLGDRNITTQVSVQGLAYNLDRQGHRRKALELRETSLKVSRESIGENHPRTAEAMSMLAISYFRFGRWEEGEVLQARGVDVYMNAFGEHHIDTKAATDRLARFRRWIRFRAFVARVIPQSIFMVVIRFLESSNAWVQRTLHYYA